MPSAHRVLPRPDRPSDKFSKLLSAWARAGYVVAAPAFPLTNDHVPGSAMNASSGQPARRRVLRARPGTGGAAPPRARCTTASTPTRSAPAVSRLAADHLPAVVFDDCCRDRRFSVGDGPRRPPSSGTRSSLDGHVPLLIAHSDTDPAIPYATAQCRVPTMPPVAGVARHAARRVPRRPSGRTTRRPTTPSASASPSTSGTPRCAASRSAFASARPRRGRRRPQLDRARAPDPHSTWMMTAPSALS